MINAAEIRARIDLVALVGESVRLKKQGAQHYGLCPWHADKSPTLRVDPKKQLWMCPSCQIGGDCFTWLKARDGVSFRVAAQDLAKRAGIEPGKPHSAPMPVAVPKEPAFPAPRVEPNLPWYGQAWMRGEPWPVLILNDFPGRALYSRIQIDFIDHDVLCFPRLANGLTASAEQMYLAPIARQAIAIAPTRDRWENERAATLLRLLEAWRIHGANSRRSIGPERDGLPSPACACSARSFPGHRPLSDGGGRLGGPNRQ